MAEPELVYAPDLPCPGPAYSTLDYIGTSHCVIRPAQAHDARPLDMQCPRNSGPERIP